MLVLAIDTATPTVVTGIVSLGGDVSPESGGVGERDGRAADPEVLSTRSVRSARGHAEILTSLIVECLDEAGTARADVDAVVVGCGPGPFTGLRVGMATAAAFGDALGIGVFGVCSLDAIAARVVRPAGETTLVVTDARRREVYWALYRGGERVSGPDVSTPAALAATMSGVVLGRVVGAPEHLDAYGGVTDPTVSAPSARGLVACAAGDLVGGRVPGPVAPLYLRRPDAVERAAPDRTGSDHPGSAHTGTGRATS